MQLGLKAANTDGSAKRRLPHLVRWILEIPLEMKLLGANLIIVGVALFLMLGSAQLGPASLTDSYIVVVALIISAIVNFALVRVALRPIESLERVAKWVSQGKLAERVPTSMVADHELTRLSTTINGMLDSLAASRERMEKLGEEVVYAEERERSQIAQELYSSIGQALADARFHIAAATNEPDRVARSSRLAEARESLRAAIDEIRNASRSAHLRPGTGPDVPEPQQQMDETTQRPSLRDDRESFDIPRGSMFDRRGRIAHVDIRALESHRHSGRPW